MNAGQREQNLNARLKAYRKPLAKKTPPPAAAHSSVFHEVFVAHPLSGESLRLDENIAVDFQRTLPRREFVFFDLESTGLGAAEQVYPFLIGIASPTTAGCELAMLFADTPAGEEEILREFIRLARGKTLVSFNGKSFDLRLIVRRAEKYSLEHRLEGLAHIDLYHLIRRIYPEKPARLIDAEARLLGFTRGDDLAGAAVAQAYFELLRFGDAGLKAKILKHNTWDVLSLVNLLGRVSSAFTLAREGKSAWAYKIHRDKSVDKALQKRLLTGSERPLDARDLSVLAKIYSAEKKYGLAARHFLASYRAGFPAAVIDAVGALARLGRKNRASRVARYALAREDERVQRKLLRYV